MIEMMVSAAMVVEFALFHYMNILRISLFLMTYTIYIVMKHTWQIRTISSKLKRQLKHRIVHVTHLRQYLYKCHFIFLVCYLGHHEFNTKIIKPFFGQSVMMQLISNVVILAGFVQGYTDVLVNPIRVIVVLQILVISLFAQCFIISTDALIEPSKVIYSSLVALRKQGHSELEPQTKISLCFYEMIHNKKPFRYDFGPMSRISKKSLFSFWGFYFGLILMAVGFSRRT